MRFLRVTLALATLLLLFRLPPASDLNGWKYSTDVGGGGYQECCTCPVIAPATLFALVTIGAIIAIALKGSEEHGHNHVHTH